MDGKFDTLEFLVDMRKELREDLQNLGKKVDSAITVLNNHETRMVVVENSRRTMLWLAGTLFAGFVTFLFDLFVNHVPKVLK